MTKITPNQILFKRDNEKKSGVIVTTSKGTTGIVYSKMGLINDKVPVYLTDATGEPRMHKGKQLKILVAKGSYTINGYVD